MRQFILTATLVAISTIVFAQNDSSGLYIKKGLVEREKGRTMEAFKNFEKAYAFDKKDKNAVTLLAKTLLDLRKYPQARQKYLELESLGNPSLETYNQLMMLSFNMRQFPDAVKYANLVKKADPSAKTAYYIGKAFYNQENYGEAIKYLTIANTEDPQNPEVPYLVARSYADMMNFKQAIPFFEKSLALQPDNSRLMYEMGLIYYAIPDDKNSLKYFLMAAEKGYKRDNEFLENLAIAYLNNKETDKGLEILSESLNRRPSDMNLLNMVAEANYDAKRYDAAISYWDKILSMDKQNASALYMIGMSYQKKGEKQKGMALCDKAIEMDPSLSKNKRKVEMPSGL